MSQRIWVQSPIINEWRELTGYSYTPEKRSDVLSTWHIGTDGVLHIHDNDGARLHFSVFYIEER